MAKSIEEILGRSINTTKELRDVIKQLQDQLVSASSDTQEWVDTATKLNAAQQKLSQVMNAGKQSIDAAEDSIVGMERQYKELYNTYKLLTEEQRNSPFGQEMAGQLEEMSNKINEVKKGVGNFKDNIGRYAQDAVAAFSSMGVSIGGLATPLGLANGGFKALNATIKANPIFWLIAAIQAIIAIFKKLKDAIMSNEESQMALNEAMSAFQPVADAVSNAFDKIGQAIVKVIGWVADAYRKVRELWGAFTDFLGITDGAAEKVRQQNKLYQELAQRTNELTKAKREQQVLNANQEAEVKRLLDEAAATTDATEKMNLLNEAKRIQQEITERNIAIAEEEYNILLEKSKLTANDAATNDKLAQAEAAVARARADGAAKTKEMTSQITALTKETDKYAEALKKEKEDLEELLKTIEENSKTELQKLEEKYNKELALLKKYGKDTTELTKQYEKERNNIILEMERERITAQRDIQLQASREPETSKLKAEFAEADFNKAKSKLETLKSSLESTNYSITETEEAWLAFGESLTPPFKGVRSLEDANLVLEILRKNMDDAARQARNIAESMEYMGQQNVSSLDLVQAKVDYLIKGEKDAAQAIKEIDAELLQNKIDTLKWELDNLELTNQEKLQKWQEYYTALKQQDDATTQALRENQEKIRESELARWEVGQVWTEESATLLDSINALGDAISQNIELSLEDEKTTEETAKKKKKQLKALQDLQLALTLVTIAADTASGIMNVWKGYAAEKAVNAQTAAATGPAAAATMAVLEGKSLAMAILQTTGLGVMGAAQMAAAVAGTISNKRSIDGMGGESGAAGTIAAPAVIETTPYSYTRQIQTTEEEDRLNQPIWVSVTDIENGLNHAQVVQGESSF